MCICDCTSKKLILQLHITARCNQRCLHCYQDDYVRQDLTFEQIEMIINQYKELLCEFNIKQGKKIRGHINITGGEPFVRKDIWDILMLLKDNEKYFSYGILSNGSYFNKDSVKKLTDLTPSFVQVSIDGDEEIHDSIRGKGNFKQTLKAVRTLSKNKIPAYISFTAHKGNYKSFSIVAKYARKVKASKLWTDRLVPIGNGADLTKDTLSPNETMDFFKIVKAEKDKKIINKLSSTEISMNRSLQFLKTGENPYRCGAGHTLITVLDNGDMLPCRRMPIVCGNLIDKNMKDIYYNNSVFKELRGELVSKGCEKCTYLNICRGGAKCISYAMFNEYFKKDPGCPL